MTAAYGYCPQCGAKGWTRERRPFGNTTCVNGHTYPTVTALNAPPAMPFVAAELRGPLVIAVADHSRSDALADLVGSLKGDSDQGVVVIPFAASALSYCSKDTLLFRGLIMVPPRAGQGVDRKAFNAWIETSIDPYMAPTAPRIVL